MPAVPVPPRTSSSPIPPPSGLRVAYEAYCTERRRQGREPVTYEEFRGTGYVEMVKQLAKRP